MICLIVLTGLNAVRAQGNQQAKQPVATVQPTQAATPIIVPGMSTVGDVEDYRLKPGDIVEIKVEKAPELSNSYPINTGGTFLFPVLGQVSADKKTTEELSQMIGSKLRGSYLTDPIVSVSVKEQSKKPVFPFFIQGAVRSPGTFQLERQPSLLKLITIAGGLNDNYGSTAFIIRERKLTDNTDQTPDDKSAKPVVANSNPKASSAMREADKSASNSETEYDLIKVNINRLLRGSFDQNIIIEPNDIVQIPKSDIFFVAGEVKAPGNFPLREGTTLRQAISLAQSTKFEAATERGIIFREDPSGKRQEIPVDIGAIMSGKKADVEIMPNDIIMVPNSKMKSVANSILKTASTGLIRSILGF